MIGPFQLASRKLPNNVEPKPECERCNERPPTHEVMSADERASWTSRGSLLVQVGPFHRQVCELCLADMKSPP